MKLPLKIVIRPPDTEIVDWDEVAICEWSEVHPRDPPDRDTLQEIVNRVNRYEKLVAACEATLMFYQSWSPEWQEKWDALTGSYDASTKGLCDFVREVLAQPADAKPAVDKSVELVVGQEYEIKLWMVKSDDEQVWVPAKCLSLGRENVSAPLFEFELTLGHLVTGRRAEGEYRRRVAEAPA